MEKVLPILHCGSREETVCFDGLDMFYKKFASGFVISTLTILIFLWDPISFLKDPQMVSPEPTGYLSTSS